MHWMEMSNQRDAHGNLTPLALALGAIADNGCDCERDADELGTCLACLCEVALRLLWSAQTEADAAGYARCKADVMAYLHQHDDFREYHPDHYAAEIEYDHHVGAAERAGKEGE